LGGCAIAADVRRRNTQRGKAAIEPARGHSCPQQLSNGVEVWTNLNVPLSSWLAADKNVDKNVRAPVQFFLQID
jgi:hypothetical protein